MSTNQEESLFSVQLSPSADCCGEVSYQVYQNGMAFPLTAGHNSPVFRISKPGRYIQLVFAKLEKKLIIVKEMVTVSSNAIIIVIVLHFNSHRCELLISA